MNSPAAAARAPSAATKRAASEERKAAAKREKRAAIKALALDRAEREAAAAIQISQAAVIITRPAAAARVTAVDAADTAGVASSAGSGAMTSDAPLPVLPGDSACVAATDALVSDRASTAGS